jgi:hypothetical protein
LFGSGDDELGDCGGCSVVDGGKLEFSDCDRPNSNDFGIIFL